jgi:hypothetical protein
VAARVGDDPDARQAAEPPGRSGVPGILDAVVDGDRAGTGGRAQQPHEVEVGGVRRHAPGRADLGRPPPVSGDEPVPAGHRGQRPERHRLVGTAQHAEEHRGEGTRRVADEDPARRPELVEHVPQRGHGGIDPSAVPGRPSWYQHWPRSRTNTRWTPNAPVWRTNS